MTNRTVEQIDLDIDENHRELRRRYRIRNLQSAHCWHLAWDRNPDLRAREDELYRERYDAAVERDQKAARIAAAQARKDRAAARREYALARRAVTEVLADPKTPAWITDGVAKLRRDSPMLASFLEALHDRRVGRAPDTVAA